MLTENVNETVLAPGLKHEGIMDTVLVEPLEATLKISRTAPLLEREGMDLES